MPFLALIISYYGLVLVFPYMWFKVLQYLPVRSRASRHSMNKIPHRWFPVTKIPLMLFYHSEIASWLAFSKNEQTAIFFIWCFLWYRLYGVVQWNVIIQDPRVAQNIFWVSFKNHLKCLLRLGWPGGENS